MCGLELLGHVLHVVPTGWKLLIPESPLPLLLQTPGQAPVGDSKAYKDKEDLKQAEKFFNDKTLLFPSLFLGLLQYWPLARCTLLWV